MHFSPDAWIRHPRGPLMTAALIVFSTSPLLADGMNLAWQTCRTSANNATLATNDFTPIMPCDDGSAPWTTRRIVISFKNSSTMTQWTGTTIALSIYTVGPGIPDFWNFAPGGCSEGMVAGAISLVNGQGCTNPYTLQPTDPSGQTDIVNIAADPANSVVSYVADHQRRTIGVDLPPSTSLGGYTANNLALPYGYADGSMGGPCSGCDAPACLYLSRLVYYSLTESRTITTPDLRQNITWAGGVGAICPGATPTRNATWGQVKALYR